MSFITKLFKYALQRSFAGKGRDVAMANIALTHQFSYQHLPVVNDRRIIVSPVLFICFIIQAACSDSTFMVEHAQPATGHEAGWSVT